MRSLGSCEWCEYRGIPLIWLALYSYAKGGIAFSTEQKKVAIYGKIYLLPSASQWGEAKIPFLAYFGKKRDTNCGQLNSLRLHHDCPGYAGDVRNRHKEEEQLQGEPMGWGGTHCTEAQGLFFCPCHISFHHIYPSPLQDWRAVSPAHSVGAEAHPTDLWRAVFLTVTHIWNLKALLFFSEVGQAYLKVELLMLAWNSKRDWPPFCFSRFDSNEAVKEKAFLYSVLSQAWL